MAVGKLTELSQSEAISILTSLPFLVAQSNTSIPQGTTVISEYEVSDGARSFTFPPQPLYVVREITHREYVEVLGRRRAGSEAGKARHFYHLGTD